MSVNVLINRWKLLKFLSGKLIEESLRKQAFLFADIYFIRAIKFYMRIKKIVYRKKMKIIKLKDVQNLDDVLPRLLLKYGVQAY